LILFSSALEFKVKKNNMINLIIDATGDKIFFKIIGNDESYTSEHINSRENFDNFVVLLSEFLEKNKVKIENINNIFVNQGPGKFSSIRASISVVKGICIANKLNFYGFNSNQLTDQNYNEIIELFNKGLLKKNLIKPQYSS
tara:strand:+ start:703 stop:1128 length:426 start_codon:yes stop_codon:yes gene_type:complete